MGQQPDPTDARPIQRLSLLGLHFIILEDPTRSLLLAKGGSPDASLDSPGYCGRFTRGADIRRRSTLNLLNLTHNFSAVGLRAAAKVVSEKEFTEYCKFAVRAKHLGGN